MKLKQITNYILLFILVGLFILMLFFYKNKTLLNESFENNDLIIISTDTINMVKDFTKKNNINDNILDTNLNKIHKYIKKNGNINLSRKKLLEIKETLGNKI